MNWIKENSSEILYVFIILVFSFITAYKKRKATLENSKVNYSFKRIFPWFIIWFLAASLLNTIGIFPARSIPYINTIGKFLIVMALTAIGLNSDFKKMLKTGIKPIILGVIVWFVVTATSIVVQHITGQI